MRGWLVSAVRQAGVKARLRAGFPATLTRAVLSGANTRDKGANPCLLLNEEEKRRGRHLPLVKRKQEQALRQLVMCGWPPVSKDFVARDGGHVCGLCVRRDMAAA